MGIGTYFIGLALSGFAALLLHVLVKLVTERWKEGFVRAVLRSLSVAVALAPAMLMKKGLGVLLPASIVVCVARSRTDADDSRNFASALTSLAVVWVISALILFLRYVAREEHRLQKEKG
jgi:hypothetical protein